jgi:hypothetical protein
MSDEGTKTLLRGEGGGGRGWGAQSVVAEGTDSMSGFGFSSNSFDLHNTILY